MTPRVGMLKTGQRVLLEIEKPAAGGRMIARADGQIVLVAGAIPGERAHVVIERVGRGVAYGQTTALDVVSADRREWPGDPLCGGCLYAQIGYHRQLQLKSEVIVDALARIGRIQWRAPIVVVPSPEAGYRMRARVHGRRGRLGWFREGSHELCSVRGTRQLSESAADILDRLEIGLRTIGLTDDLEIELSENVAATERTIHLEVARTIEPSRLLPLADGVGLTGLTVADPMSSGVAHAVHVAGSPRVHDRISVGGREVSLGRHVLAFFQGNRFLLSGLVANVVEAIAPEGDVIDLYAGAGLFALSAAVVKGARVVAVEGDLVSAADLSLNAASCGGAVEAVHQSVEQFTATSKSAPGTIVLDPPRTGLSKEAHAGIVSFGAARLVYVSCDVATFARDAHGFVEAGYELTDIAAFDLFPNTAHVETVGRFERR